MATEVATLMLPLHRARPRDGDPVLALADGVAEGVTAEIRLDTRGLYILIPATGESYGIDLRGLAGATLHAIVRLPSRGAA
ncbi:hypothetical protein RNZ50_15780 [Paracoccaceae bacterium Fryx2]|nr:hypothetical protein [Paracoccaceae bacterium Fryx2]